MLSNILFLLVHTLSFESVWTAVMEVSRPGLRDCGLAPGNLGLGLDLVLSRSRSLVFQENTLLVG